MVASGNVQLEVAEARKPCILKRRTSRMEIIVLCLLAAVMGMLYAILFPQGKSGCKESRSSYGRAAHLLAEGCRVEDVDPDGYLRLGAKKER